MVAGLRPAPAEATSTSTSKSGYPWGGGVGPVTGDAVNPSMEARSRHPWRSRPRNRTPPPSTVGRDLLEPAADGASDGASDDGGCRPLVGTGSDPVATQRALAPVVAPFNRRRFSGLWLQGPSAGILALVERGGRCAADCGGNAGAEQGGEQGEAMHGGASLGGPTPSSGTRQRCL